MHIGVNVALDEGDRFAYTPEEACEQVIVALGGNLTKDSASVSVSMPAGTYEPPQGDATEAPA